MRLLALVLLMFFQAPIGGPTQVQDPAYPLRVRILQRGVMRHNGFVVRSWGRADLVDQNAQATQGFDYESTCSVLFMVNHGDEEYSARWKKPGHELEMLVSRIGSGKSDKCSVKADLNPYIYLVKDHAIITRPLRQ